MRDGADEAASPNAVPGGWDDMWPKPQGLSVARSFCLPGLSSFLDRATGHSDATGGGTSSAALELDIWCPCETHHRYKALLT